MCRAVYVLHLRHSNQLNHALICLRVCFAISDFEKGSQPGVELTERTSYSDWSC